MNAPQQTLTAQIVPSYIDDPKPGKTNYSVKDSSGARWSVPPLEAQKLVKGQVCVVAYRINNFNGKSFNMVERVDVVQAPVPTPAPVAQYAPPVQQAQAPLPPAPTYQPPEDPKGEEIFVTGVVGRAMGSGNFSVEDIPALTTAAVFAWRNRGAT